MADLYQRWDAVSNRMALREGKISSAGAADSGKLVALDTTGKIDPSMLPGTSIDSALSSEAITAGNAINIWDDAGTRKVRKADSSVPYPCHGFATETVASGVLCKFDTDGGKQPVTGVTIGLTYYLSTGGAVTTNPAETATHIIQKVGYGSDAGVLAIEISEPMYVD